MYVETVPSRFLFEPPAACYQSWEQWLLTTSEDHEKHIFIKIHIYSKEVTTLQCLLIVNLDKNIPGFI